MAVTFVKSDSAERIEQQIRSYCEHAPSALAVTR
jgi:hypothetical protein